VIEISSLILPVLLNCLLINPARVITEPFREGYLIELEGPNWYSGGLSIIVPCLLGRDWRERFRVYQLYSDWLINFPWVATTTYLDLDGLSFLLLRQQQSK
jgi:hypothetical protein